MQMGDEAEKRLKSFLILGFIHYFPLACEARLTEKMDLLNFCRDSLDETLSLEERGKALAGVETILQRLEDG